VVTPVVKSSRLSTGVTLPYVEQGDPSGIPVLLFHGVTDSFHSFDLVLPHFSPRIRAFAVTQRGHGDADKPERGYRAADFAADVPAFLDAVGLASAVVVGHSMGGTNAQRFAIDHPRHVRGLVLAGSFAGYRDKPDFVEFTREVAALSDPIDPGFAREFQETTLARPVAPEYLDLIVRESLKVPARVWRATFAAFLDDECTAELGRIAAPTLALWGSRDAFASRADQDALLAAIPGARLIVYEGAGHALHWEEPKRFAADVEAFAMPTREP
jgi:pimeloyl-ACP methyl ester carboxylesterase